jgi:serine/threonine-protein kinase
VVEQEQRDLLAESGRSMLRDLIAPLRNGLVALPGLEPNSLLIGGDTGGYYSLGQARIVVMDAHQAAKNPELPFDVVLYGSIAVAMLNADPPQWGGRCHSLWYCDAQIEGEYHWFETAFHNVSARRINAGVRNVGQKIIQMEPYDRSPTDTDAIYAISPVVHTEQVAVAFLALVGDAANSFVERWLSWFADAVEGQLASAMMLPEGNPLESWRRSP